MDEAYRHQYFQAQQALPPPPAAHPDSPESPNSPYSDSGIGRSSSLEGGQVGSQYTPYATPVPAAPQPSVQEELQASYHQLSHLQEQLLNLRTDLAYRSQENGSLRMQLEKERNTVRSLQEELMRRDADLSQALTQVAHLQAELAAKAKAAPAPTQQPRPQAFNVLTKEGLPRVQAGNERYAAPKQPTVGQAQAQAQAQARGKNRMNGVMFIMDRADPAAAVQPGQPHSADPYSTVPNFAAPSFSTLMGQFTANNQPPALQNTDWQASQPRVDAQPYVFQPYKPQEAAEEDAYTLSPYPSAPATPANHPLRPAGTTDPQWPPQPPAAVLPINYQQAMHLGAVQMTDAQMAFAAASNFAAAAASPQQQQQFGGLAPNVNMQYATGLQDRSGQVAGGLPGMALSQSPYNLGAAAKPTAPKPAAAYGLDTAGMEYYAALDRAQYPAMQAQQVELGGASNLYTVLPLRGSEMGMGFGGDDGMHDLQGRTLGKALGMPANAQTFKLLKSLQAASSQAQVVELASQLPVEQLDVLSICTIMNRLAKVSHSKCPTGQLHLLVSQLLRQALTMVDSFEHQHASNILHAVAKLNIKDTRFVSVMKERIMHPSVVNELNPQDIANTVWALATLHTTNNKLIDVLTQRALVPSVLNQFNSQHVTNIAWAMAKLGIVNTTLLNALAERAMCPEVLNDFNAQGVANTIWACAKSGFVHLKLMNALAERAMHAEVMNKFISQNLANIAWGWAKLALLDERLMHALANRAMEPAVLAAFNTQEVANMTWAFARLGVLNEPLLLALAERAMHPAVLSKYTSQDLGNTSWAFAKLGVLHEPLMDALAERCMYPDVVATFNTQNVANVAWAFARLGIRNEALLSMLAQRSMCRPVMYRFKPHQIGNTAWSFAKLGLLNRPLMDALAKRAMDQSVLSAFQAQDIANVLWAYATLELMTPQLKQRMEERALDPQVLATFSQQDIATTVMAYAKMGIHSAELLEALGRRALEAGILQESPQNNDDW
eukprot:GGOE01027161.1.p1 GENE.GGOE01027161.1~~GGOE01027161.1.p1  ORF type:complete len:1059 (+),score=374.07 GGOE01027161.1:163-3177(+)